MPGKKGPPDLRLAQQLASARNQRLRTRSDSAKPSVLEQLGERSATTEGGAASGQRLPFPDYVSTQGPVPIPCGDCSPRVVCSRLREPHRVTSNDLVGGLGAIPAAWFAHVSRRARSVDVFQRGRFLFLCQPRTSITKEPAQVYQGLALLQALFAGIITRLLMPLRWLDGTG